MHTDAHIYIHCPQDHIRSDTHALRQQYREKNKFEAAENISNDEVLLATRQSQTVRTNTLKVIKLDTWLFKLSCFPLYVGGTFRLIVQTPK